MNLSPGTVDDIQTITAIGASLIAIFGGLGALFRLIRTLALLNKNLEGFALRLEPSVSGTIFTRAGTTYLIVKSRLNNVGATRFTLDQEGTAVSLVSYE